MIWRSRLLNELAVNLVIWSSRRFPSPQPLVPNL